MGSSMGKVMNMTKAASCCASTIRKYFINKNTNSEADQKTVSENVFCPPLKTLYVVVNYGWIAPTENRVSYHFIIFFLPFLLAIISIFCCRSG